MCRNLCQGYFNLTIMKKIFTTLLLLLAASTAYCITFTSLSLPTKTFVAGEVVTFTIRVAGEVSTDPITFKVTTGSSTTKVFTIATTIGAMAHPGLQIYTFNWTVPTNALTTNQGEVLVNNLYGIAKVISINNPNPTEPVDPVDPTDPTDPVDPTITAITLQTFNLTASDLKAYDINGILIKEYYGLFKDMNLQAGFYIIQVNNSDSFKVRVQ